MSKHKGNVVDPWSVLDKQGADAVRWYFYSSSAPWLPSRFYDEAVSETQRKFMGTLWNTYAFYILYADIDKFDPTKYELHPSNIMDQWVLSRLNSLVRTVTEGLDSYHIVEPARELGRFVDELSNWYVRRCRDRFWGSGMEQDKIDAFMTLYTVLETMARLLAPFTPFMAESIYQNLVRTVDVNAPLSVHLCKWPQADASLINAQLEQDMDAVLNVVNLGRSCRNTANIKNRQPISKIYVSGIDHLDETFLDVIRGELNAKEVELGAAAAEYITYHVKPQMRTLGPKYGKLLGGIRTHLAQADGMLVVSTVRSGKAYEFDLDGITISLLEDDILVEPAQREGFVAETSGDFAVIIDTTLTPELIEEGNVREIISKIQTMRKEAGFEVTDKISLSVKNNETVAGIIRSNEEQIKKEVLARSVQYGATDGFEKEWNINGEKVTLAVKKEQ